mmetsp:Transcript_108313/g.334518  ORF Transcript_108313/g.334518 Transcript_108313/m.334518 type:complete len:178 (-) Transcript_108313:71-604(-)|eukprot:CAMPEP_0175731318 /NCGR_PEP_ID=MMETSP0097-20121207/50777_1 /TAXON_ID=311494 /ORGANISM="Alexandrium monilatum, Strain CCMP3105" /LENGTH=177 /DNA_ID=CAMNT_0017039247 /DNA_START=53 /DNA_END=586 /DNA_ORIENTATION=+
MAIASAPRCCGAARRSLVLARQLLAGPEVSVAVEVLPCAAPPGERTPSERLFAAAKAGDVAACREALSAGADVNSKDEGSLCCTALHMAAAGAHIEVCQLLRRAGAIVDPRSESGETPLIVAARSRKSLAVCEFLLAEGADPAAKARDEGHAQTAREYLDDMYKELGAPPRCGLGSS